MTDTPDYEPEDFTAAREALRADLRAAHDRMAIVRSLAALAALDDGDVSSHAYAALEALDALDMLAPHCLATICDEGKIDSDEALYSAWKDRDDALESVDEQMDWERSMTPVRL